MIFRFSRWDVSVPWRVGPGGGSVVVNPLGSLRLKFCHKLVQRVGRDGKGVSFRVWSWFEVCQLSKSSSF